MAKRATAKKAAADRANLKAHTDAEMANYDLVKGSYRPLTPKDLNPKELARLATVRATLTPSSKKGSSS
jgi:hypothetical protein